MNPTSTPKSIVVYSTVWCPDCKRAKKFFGEQRIVALGWNVLDTPEGTRLVHR